ncbi:hypothetical protein [Caldiplasma sukawensis]
MSSKFSVFRIVVDHFNTLYDYKKSNDDKIARDYLSIFINFILPLLVAVLFIWFRIFIKQSEFTVILTAYSVFAALLLNLMILVFSIVNREREKPSEKRDTKKINLLRETYENIQFTVLISVLIIFLILLMLFIPSDYYLVAIFSFWVYYLIFVFLVTLFMVLKRTHAIMSKE